jgi:hypothetical protein
VVGDINVASCNYMYTVYILHTISIKSNVLNKKNCFCQSAIQIIDYIRKLRAFFY